MMRSRTRNGRKAKGQALVEFALVIPIFLALLFGVIDLGRVIWANDSLASAAREGARYASVHAGTGNEDSEPLTLLATKPEIKAYTQGFAIGGGDTTVTVCFSTVHYASSSVGCSGDDDEQGAAYQRGNLVTVTVTSQIPVLTGAVLGFGSFTVTGTSTVLINN
jgi:Flp pilus assembly protein TadG